jgi:hypothetical protein
MTTVGTGHESPRHGPSGRVRGGGEPGTAYIEHVVSALGHGVTSDEIVGVLVTLLPTVGPARVTAFAAATLEASSA